MKDDTDKLALFVVFCLFNFGFGVFFGRLFTLDHGAPKATKSATIFCVEKPKECKIRYDYYKLEEKTK